MDRDFATLRAEYLLTEAEVATTRKRADRHAAGLRKRYSQDLASASLDNGPEFSTTELHKSLACANSIRLLSLSTDEHSDSLECLLDEASLDREDGSGFTALSYAWHETIGRSKADEKRTIVVNGHRVKISPNLFAALSSIFADSPDARLWVDALCINQADVVERSAQVSLMSSIYGQAEKVVVWLGEFPSSRLQIMLKAWSLIHYASNKPNQHELVKELGFFSDTLDDGLFQALDDIFARQWFRRSWTYQEIILAKVGEVRLGSLKTPWQDFAAGCQWLTQELGPADWLKGNHEDVWADMSPRPLQRSTLSRLLTSLSGRSATEPRDKLYSVLGLLTNHPFKIDYGASVVQIFTEAVRYCIAKEGSLALLELAIFQADWLRCQTDEDRLQWQEQRKNLPSWVPDLSHAPSLEFRPKRNDSWKAETPLDHSSYPQPGLIMVQGSVIARWTVNLQQGLVLHPTPPCTRSGQTTAASIIDEFPKHDDMLCSCWVGPDGGLVRRPGGRWIHILDPPYWSTVGQRRAEVIYGDWLCVLKGAACPYVLRPQKLEGDVCAFRLISVLKCLRSPVIGTYEWNLSEQAPEGLSPCFTWWETSRGSLPDDVIDFLLV